MIAPWPAGRAESHDVIVPLVVVVDSAGRVTEASPETSVSKALDAAAIAAARSFTFEPARRDGVAVSAKIRIVVRFVGTVQQVRAERVPDVAAQTDSGRTEAPPSGSSPLAKGARSTSPSPASSAQASTTQPADVSPEEIVVEGASGARSASDKVVSRPVLQAAPHRTAADLLRVVPGVFLTQHSGEGKAYQIFYRGFDAVHGQDLEIWAGGAPVNDVSNLHGQGYADLNFLMPEVVRSIRVSPGSFDPRQGDFAVAGSLALTLGYDQPGVTAKATVGQFGTRRYFLAYRPEDSTDANFAAVETYSTDGFGTARAARRTSGVAQSTFDLGDGTLARVLATAYAAHFDSAGVLRLSDVDSGRLDRFASYDPEQGGSAHRSSLVLDLTHDHAESSWSVSPYVVLHGMRLRQNLTGFLPDPARDDPSALDGNSEQQLNEALTVGAKSSYRQAVHWLSPVDALETGMSTRLDWIDQSQRRLSVFTDQVTLDQLDAAVRATDVAGYIDFDLHPTERWRLQGGLRLDGLAYTIIDEGGAAAGEARSAQGAHLGKKVSSSFRVLPGLSLSASYGEGFRSPQARSLSEGQTTPFTRARSYEAGVRYRDRQLEASAATFLTDLSDDIAFDQATARNEATPATRRTGLSVDITATPVPWFVSSTSLTYTRAEFAADGFGYVAGALLPYAPQVVGRTDLSFTPRLGHVYHRPLHARLGMATTYLGRRPLPFGEFGHDALLLDARAGLRWSHVELSVDVWNVLDATWFDGEYVYASSFEAGATASLLPQRHVTVGAPRNVWVTLALVL